MDMDGEHLIFVVFEDYAMVKRDCFGQEWNVMFLQKYGNVDTVYVRSSENQEDRIL